jgi:hypothetical protein
MRAPAEEGAEVAGGVVVAAVGVAEEGAVDPRSTTSSATTAQDAGESGSNRE